MCSRVLVVDDLGPEVGQCVGARGLELNLEIRRDRRPSDAALVEVALGEVVLVGLPGGFLDYPQYLQLDHIGPVGVGGRQPARPAFSARSSSRSIRAICSTSRGGKVWLLGGAVSAPPSFWQRDP